MAAVDRLELVAIAAVPLHGIDDDLVTLAHGAFCAAFTRPEPRFFRQGRRALAEAMVRRQGWLERLHARADILPALPGQAMEAEDVPGLLAANAATLRAGLASIERLSQYQVVVKWDPAAGLSRFRDSPELAGLDAGRPGFGKRVQAAGEALRSRLGEEYRQIIRHSVNEALDLPCDGPEMVVNQVCLTPRGGATLEAALESIDATWPEGLRISMIGPTAPSSFAAMELRTPGAADIAAARQLLGGPGDNTEDIRAAARQRIVAAHPDGGGEDQVAVERIAAARDLLLRDLRGREALAEAGLADRPLRLICLRSDGMAGHTRLVGAA